MCSSSLGSTKHPWSKDEDDSLRLLIRQHGARDWGKLAKHIPGRNGKQCHQRWTYFLDPDVRKGVWSEDEDQRIVHLQSLIGNKWAKTAEHLPGRTGHAVKNRFVSLSKRQRRGSEMSSRVMMGGSSTGRDIGDLMHSSSSSMHAPHGSHHAASASASSAPWAQHRLESYMGPEPPQVPPRSASVPVVMGLAQSKASDIHSQQYQMPLASQQLQSTQHMRHQHETHRYPWQDIHSCPVSAREFRHMEPRQFSHQHIPPDAGIPAYDPMGGYGCQAPNRHQHTPFQSSDTNVRPYNQPDELKSFHKHHFPAIPLKSFLAQEQGARLHSFGRHHPGYLAGGTFEHSSYDDHESN